MILMGSLRRAFAILAIAALGGCSIYSLPGQEQPAPVEQKQPDYQQGTDSTPPATAPPVAVPPEPNDSNAYGGLLAKAEEARDRGDYEQALAILENSLSKEGDPDWICKACGESNDAFTS